MTAQEVKARFRLMMNGPAAQSMRDKGLGYHINWGAPLPELRKLAAEIGPDYDLAIALWKDDVRECKIVATMIMPPEKVLPEVIDIWMEQTTTQEMAEIAASQLYWRLPYAGAMAYKWIAMPGELPQIAGYHTLARLFRNGQQPNERGINEYIDQAKAALAGDSLAVRKAAAASMKRFRELGLVYERIADSAMRGR